LLEWGSEGAQGVLQKMRRALGISRQTQTYDLYASTEINS